MSHRAAQPTITFDDALSIGFNGKEVNVLHSPHAHTDGDALVFLHRFQCRAHARHLLQPAFPFVDSDSGSNMARVIKAVETVL